MAKKKPKSKWIIKKREFECVGIQHRVTMSTRRYMKVRVEEKPMLVKFKREPDNPHDKNAIAVYAAKDPDNPYKGMKLGYIRRKTAETLAPELDSGEVEFGISFMTALDEMAGIADLQVKLRVKRGKENPI